MTYAASFSEYSNLQVGDLVRIGEHENEGFTDYLTIVEIKTFSKLVNGTGTDARVSTGTGTTFGTDKLLKPTTLTDFITNEQQSMMT
eukprot:1324237-Prymnesium_polylepis.1